MMKHRKYLLFLCVLLTACFLVFVACKEGGGERTSDSSVSITEASSSEFSQEKESANAASGSMQGSEENTASEETSSRDKFDSADSSTDPKENENSENTEGNEGSEGSSSTGNEGSSVEPTPVPHEHDWQESSRVEYCTAIGEAIYNCTGCKETKSEELPALEHDEVIDEAVSATCQISGKTEGSHCSRCNEVIHAQENLGTVGHSYADYACKWCDLVELNFEESQDAKYYICTGTNATYARRVVIPDVIDGKPVKVIEENAFAVRYELNSVTFGTNIESIKERAFFACYNLVEIYNNSKMDLTKVVGVTDYVKDIYTKDEVSKIRTDENGYVIYENGEERLLIGYKGNEKQIRIPEGITEVNPCVFTTCEGITKIVVSSTVKKLNTYAFAHCPELTSITIGKNVTYIGQYLVNDADNKLNEVVFEDPKGWLTGKDPSGLDGLPFGESIEDPKVACLGFKNRELELYWTKQE